MIGSGYSIIINRENDACGGKENSLFRKGRVQRKERAGCACDRVCLREGARIDFNGLCVLERQRELVFF